MYERGTPEVGTANADVAARAEGASIAASNPAGVSRLDKAEILIGIRPVITDVKFEPGPGTTTTGPTDDGGVVLPVAGHYYVQESALITFDLAPTISYRVNDWLSIGAGPVFQ